MWLPLDVLPPGAVISWGNVSGFGSTVLPAGAIPNTSIAGFAATITTDKPGVCGSLQGDETIAARITHPGGNDDFLMRACLRGPNLPAAEQLVTAILSSVTIPNT